MNRETTENHPPIKTTPKEIQTKHFIAVSVMIALYYITLRLNLVHIPIDRDEGLYGYMGKAILEGYLPYKDFFDQKPPLIFYLHAFIMIFVPPTAEGIHSFLHIYNFLTLITLYFSAKIFFKNTAAGLYTAGTYAAISASHIFQGFTASTEALYLLPMSLSILLVIIYTETSNKQAGILILSGIVGATACWMKQTAFIGLFFWYLYLIYSQYSLVKKSDQISLAKILKPSAYWLAGGIGLSTCIITYFAYHGILEEMLHWSFTRNIIYARESTGEVSGIWGSFMAEAVKVQISFFIIIILAIVYALKQKSPKGIALTIFLAFQVFTTTLGPMNYHYLAVILPAVSLLTGYCFYQLSITVTNDKFKKFIPLIFLLIVIFNTVQNRNYYFINNPKKNIEKVYTASPFFESIAIAKYINENTDEEDSIFILGAETQILLLSHRKSANPYLHPIAFFTSAYPNYLEHQNKAWDSIKKNKPKYIVICDNDWSLRGDGIAEINLLNNILGLIGNEYEIEKSFIIHEERRALIFKDAMDKLGSPLELGPYPIVLLKRTDSGD